MNSVGFLAAGAAAGALAMHFMSRARKQFEPGVRAVCGVRCAACGAWVRSATCSPVLPQIEANPRRRWRRRRRQQQRGGCAARVTDAPLCPCCMQPGHRAMWPSRRTRTGTRATRCRSRMLPAPRASSATCRAPLSPRMMVEAFFVLAGTAASTRCSILRSSSLPTF